MFPRTHVYMCFLGETNSRFRGSKIAVTLVSYKSNEILTWSESSDLSAFELFHILPSIQMINVHKYILRPIVNFFFDL
jgi:hypothetical protein